MAANAKTPQEKKSLSYQKDRRNTVRENSKASRKGIPLAKARANRSDRHAQDHVLAAAHGSNGGDALTAIENLIRGTAPRKWRKTPDEPLGEHLKRKIQRKERIGTRNDTAQD